MMFFLARCSIDGIFGRLDPFLFSADLFGGSRDLFSCGVVNDVPR